AGPELESSVADEVECGCHLGGADRMIVWKRQEPHAVADSDPARLRRDRAVERLRRRAVRELGQEVVLDRPEVREADGLAAHGLRDDVVVRVALAALVPWPRDRNLVEETE